jgi:epoxyqueuosine reductase QueG
MEVKEAREEKMGMEVREVMVEEEAAVIHGQNHIQQDIVMELQLPHTLLTQTQEVVVAQMVLVAETDALI